MKENVDWEWRAFPAETLVRDVERVISSFARVHRDRTTVTGISESGREVRMILDDHLLVVEVRGLGKPASESWFIQDLSELLDWIHGGRVGDKPNGSLMGSLL